MAHAKSYSAMALSMLRHAKRKAQGGELTAEDREHIAGKNFALPGRKYPIEDESHARNALSRVSEYGSPEEKEEVSRKVHAKYPGMEARGGEVLDDGQHDGHEENEHHPVHVIGKMLAERFLAHKKAKGGMTGDLEEGEGIQAQDYPPDYEDEQLDSDEEARPLENSPFDAADERGEDQALPRRHDRAHATHFARSYFARRALGRRG